MFFKKIQKNLGIEINDHIIRVVEISSFQGVKEIRALNEVVLPSGIVKKGCIKDNKLLAKHLKTALQSAEPMQIKNKRVHFALPDDLLFVSLLKTKKEDDRGIKSIIEDQYRRNIPIKMSESEYSYKVLEKNKNDEGQELLSVILVAALRKDLLAWQNFFEDEGLFVEYFDMDSLASYRGLFAEHNKEHVLLINFKHNKLRFSVFSEFGLEYDYSNFYDTDVLKSSLSKTVETQNDSSFRALVEDLEANIKYYRDNYLTKGERLDKGLLLGVEEFSKDLPSIFKNEIEDIDWQKPEALFDNDLETRYIQALGLALRPWQDNFEKTDPFLPCIGHVYSLETKIKNKEENVIHFLYKIKNTVIFPLLFLLLVFGAWLFLGLIRGSEKMELEQKRNVPEESEQVANPIAEPESEQTEQEDIFLVVDEIGMPLNVRSGPGTDNNIIGQVNPGSEQVLKDEKDGWYRIEWTGEENAWISGSYATLEE